MGKAEAVRAAVRLTADALLAVAIAPRCAACDSVLEYPTAGPVCAACWAAVRAPAPPLCRTCGDPLPSWRVVSLRLSQCARCRRGPTFIDAGICAGDYDGSLRAIVHAFKYDGRRSLAVRLGRMMRESGADLLFDTACVVPVPLHPWRRVHRGFNQAADLARELDRPVVRALWRARPTTTQAGLTAAARHRNVRRAFVVSPLLRSSTRARYIEGKVVVLVDDVRTTGATLNACAEALKRAGAREVRALTAAGRGYTNPA